MPVFVLNEGLTWQGVSYFTVTNTFISRETTTLDQLTVGDRIRHGINWAWSVNRVAVTQDALSFEELGYGSYHQNL